MDDGVYHESYSQHESSPDSRPNDLEQLMKMMAMPLLEIKNCDIHRWPKPAVARESPRCAMQDSLAV
jgi:hypothetical protein